MMVKNCYPLPSSPSSSTTSGEGDEWKAAFWTNWELFELLIMFFGLTNSPFTFQMMMNDIFQNLIAEGIVYVYLDDILIYTKMQEEHCRITHLVLECLCQHQLYLKPEKHNFEQTQIKYLGLIILHRAVEMDLVKVADVVEWPEPKNKKEDFLHHTHLLFDLMGKNVTWSWGPLEQMAFDTLKCRGGQLQLCHWGCALTAIPGEWEVASSGLYSKSLNVVEWNYKIHDKEMLAIIWLLEEWQHFLEGAWHKFEAQWFLYLVNFNFSLHHKPGQSMGKPDTLFWRADHGTEKGDNSNIVLLHSELFAIQAMEGLAIKGAEVDILQDIWWGNQDGQQEELVAQAAQCQVPLTTGAQLHWASPY
ncbi:hypothetical protein E4T56_gene19250 [Termitomyces sp. T112]|nr:hypothetical protein E4T56_gene19250 [Termitomyces sp. T112]